jgi:hypothetical protein
VNEIMVTSPHNIEKGTIVKLSPFCEENVRYKDPISGGHITYTHFNKGFKGEMRVEAIWEGLWPQINGRLYARNMLLVKGVDYDE